MEFKSFSLLTLNSCSGGGSGSCVANLQNSFLSFFKELLGILCRVVHMSPSLESVNLSFPFFSCLLIFLNSYSHMWYLHNCGSRSIFQFLKTIFICQSLSSVASPEILGKLVMFVSTRMNQLIRSFGDNMMSI